MKLRFLACLAGILLLAACNKVQELNDIEIVGGDAEFAVPLVTANFSLQKLLENFGELALITVEEDGCIRLTYEGEVLREGAEVITEAINEVLPLGFAVPITENQTVLPFSIPAEYEFDFIRLKAGNLLYAFTLAETDTINLTLTFPNFLLNGQPITYTTYAEGGQSFYGNTLAPTDLAGAVISPEEDGTLLVNYTATDLQGNDFQFGSGAAQLGFTIADNLQFDYLEGYLGEEVFDSTPGEILIDFFDDFIRGDVYFADPTITMTVKNSFGLPVSSKAEYFEVVTVDGDTLPLTSDQLGEDLRVDFDFPSLDEVGEVKETVFVFNKDNSNIADILGSGPTKIRYDVDAVPNPDQNTEVRGFISCESEYVVDLKADLPVYGRADGFGASDEFDLDFSGYDDVKSAEFKIVTENALPLDIGMQIYFADRGGVLIDSLFAAPTTLIASPEVDEEGISIGQSKEEFLVPIEEDRFRKIADEAGKIIVNSVFSTTDQGTVPVKVLADQEVEIRMGMKLRRE